MRPGSANPGSESHMSGTAVVLITTFLASAVEAIEMVTIVVGVGATRGWRSTLIGAVAGFAVLTVVVVVVGTALTAIPIGALRFIVGALLLVFGLQWFRKGVVRVAARGLAGIGEAESGEAERWRGRGIDWTAFAPAFKGVLLEGLEVAFIDVSLGASAGAYAPAIVGAVSAVVIVGGAAAASVGLVRLIPRSALQLIVGTL